jgi:hypothetical protein
MEKEFVPYQQALELKELGFDEPCFGKFYHNHLEIGGSWLNSEFNKDEKDGNIFTSAPLYQQVFKWFREKHSLFHSIDPLGYNMCLGLVGQLGKLQSCNVPNYGTYEEAELECINFLITTLKLKKC